MDGTAFPPAHRPTAEARETTLVTLASLRDGFDAASALASEVADLLGSTAARLDRNADDIACGFGARDGDGLRPLLDAIAGALRLAKAAAIEAREDA